MSEDAPRRKSIERLRERKARHQQRGKVYRVSFAAVGIAIVLLGLLLIPLPGPGWVIVALGIGMLALEFDRAERLLERILDRIEAARERTAAASRWQKALLALVVVAGVAGAVTAYLVWDVPYVPG